MNSAVKRLQRFGLIGIVSTGLYFVLLLLLQDSIDSTVLLTALCYGAAMIFNFSAQGLFTFQAKKLTGTHLFRYSIMQGSALIANSGAMFIAVDQWGVGLIVAQLMVTGCITVATYLASQRWVYR